MVRFTDEQLKAMAVAIADGANLGQIAERTRTAYHTLRRHLKNPATYIDMARAFRRVKSGMGYAVIDSLYRAYLFAERPDGRSRRRVLREALRKTHPREMDGIDVAFGELRRRAGYGHYVADSLDE